MQNKLTGPSYYRWKRNLDILFESLEYIYVLENPYPIAKCMSPKKEELAYDKLKYNDCKVRSWILVSITHYLFKMYASYDMVFDLDQNVKYVYGLVGSILQLSMLDVWFMRLWVNPRILTRIPSIRSIERDKLLILPALCSLKNT